MLIGNLDVPQTESQAEKDAAAAKKAAEEEAEKQAEVEAQATQEQANAASRNESRSSVTYSDASGSVSAGAGASIDRAYSLIGQSMDCTALVSQALAARGINFHGWPEAGRYSDLCQHRWMERWCTLRSCGVVCRQRSGGPWWMEWL